MHATDRQRHLVASSDSRSPEARRIMTERERLEHEAKGRRTATDVKLAGELLKDIDWR